MSIRRIEQVTCSLNAGYIFSVDYSWSPDGGVAISICFVNQSGSYSMPTLSTASKVHISIGGASFSMYAVEASIELSEGRRVLKVDFVDEFHKLSNYYIALTGRGCGSPRVYTLGRPVDTRTDAQKTAASLDPQAEQIRQFTTFDDVEYTFNDFLIVLRQRFSVSIGAFYDSTVTRAFVGTFREVLDSWCDYYNLSYFFENGIIKIFDPTTLFIALPSQPADCIEYNRTESIRDTYGKTVFNYLQQSGGEFPLNQTSDDDGNLYVRTETLYPIGYEFGLEQTLPDPKQVAAAAYGQAFWFLYNYFNGTAPNECGWTPISTANISGTPIINGFNRGLNPPAKAAVFAEGLFNAKFEAYSNYGKNIAGRYYMSSQKVGIDIDQGFQWFNETEGQIFTFTDDAARTKMIEPRYLVPGNGNPQIISETIINQQYPGINYFGDRMLYIDQYDASGQVEKLDPAASGPFVLSDTIQGIVNQYAQLLIQGLDTSRSLDTSALQSVEGVGAQTFVIYQDQTLPDSITSLFAAIGTQVAAFVPRYTSIPLKGISRADYANMRARQTEDNDVKIVNNNTGPTVNSNTGVLKTVKNGVYTVYYNKYSKCAFATSDGAYFGHRFMPREISCDIGVNFVFNKSASNTYTITRDFLTLNQLINNVYLSQLAQPRSFPTRTVSMSFNYFRAVPGNFLSSGLVGMQVQVGAGGISASYRFSNEVLAIRECINDLERFEQNVKNSWIRRYSPKSTIS